MTNVSPRGEGNPGISPARLENIPAGDQERSFDPLILGPIGNIPPAGGNIPSPIGNITGPSGISSAHRENHRPAGWGISPARSGASPAGGNIPGPISVISRAGLHYPLGRRRISSCPSPHWEYHRPAGIFPGRPIGNFTDRREYSRPIWNIPDRRGIFPSPWRRYPRAIIPVPFLFGGILRMTPYMDSEGPGPGRIAHMVYKRVAQVRYLAEHDTRSRTLSKR